MDSVIEIAIIICSGFFSGLFVGMGSGTTGAIMITTLTAFLRFSAHKSIGTSLTIESIIGLIAGLIFFIKGRFNIKPAIPLIFSSSIGAFIGSQFTAHAPEVGLLLFISTMLILLGASFLIKGIHTNIDFIGKKIHIEKFKNHKLIFFTFIGLLFGFISGFTGMGIGGVVALFLMLILDYDMHMAIGTSLLMMFFISGSGAIGHLIKDEILITAAYYAGISAIIGAVSGSFYANKIDENKLGRLIGLIIVIFGIILLFRGVIKI